MTAEPLRMILDKIRSVDPETRRKGLQALRDALSLIINLIDVQLNKEVKGNAEKKDEST